MRPTPAFLLALAFGGEVTPGQENPNVPGQMTDFEQSDLQIVLDEGRIQLDHATSKLEHVQSRAQALLTVALASLAFATGAFGRLDRVDGWAEVVASGVLVLGMILVLLGVGLAAAAIVVRADFHQVDTTQISNMSPPILSEVAADYAVCVKRGEITVAERVTIFRLATRYTVWGAILVALVYAITA